jgi:hypothetical protein
MTSQKQTIGSQKVPNKRIMVPNSDQASSNLDSLTWLKARDYTVVHTQWEFVPKEEIEDFDLKTKT